MSVLFCLMVKRKLFIGRRWSRKRTGHGHEYPPNPNPNPMRDFYPLKTLRGYCMKGRYRPIICRPDEGEDGGCGERFVGPLPLRSLPYNGITNRQRVPSPYRDRSGIKISRPCNDHWHQNTNNSIYAGAGRCESRSCRDSRIDFCPTATWTFAQVRPSHSNSQMRVLERQSGRSKTSDGREDRLLGPGNTWEHKF